MGASRQRQRPQELKKKHRNGERDIRDMGKAPLVFTTRIFHTTHTHTHTHTRMQSVFPAPCKRKTSDPAVMGPHFLWQQSLQLQNSCPLSKSSPSPVYPTTLKCPNAEAIYHYPCGGFPHFTHLNFLAVLVRYLSLLTLTKRI